MERSKGDEVNRERYGHSETVDFYRGRQSLFPAERRALEGFVAPGSRLLDIGIGVGRTTANLHASYDYVGIDWAPEMVLAAAEVNPGVELQVGDAAELAFADASFDAVLFSFNGIDSVSVQNRRRVYREVCRVLRTDGIFIFSSHNPRWIILPPQDHSLRVFGGWLRRLPLAAARGISQTRFRRGRGTYIDPIHGSVVMYSASPRTVRMELADTGFKVVVVDPGRSPIGLTSPWFYYVGRKV